MKKFLASLLILVMACSVSACSSKDDKGNNAAASELLEGKIVLTEDSKDIYLVDTDEYSVLLNEVEFVSEEDSTTVAELSLKTKNKSADTKYSFSLKEGSVDGLAEYTSFYDTLEPGAAETSRELISVPSCPSSDREAVKDVSIATFTLVIDNKSDSEVEEVSVPIALLFKDENSIELYEREVKSTDRVVYDSDTVKVTFLAFEDYEYYSSGYFYVENKSDKIIGVQGVSTSFVVNSDKEVNLGGLVTSEILPNCNGYADIFIDDGAMEDMEITSTKEIESVEFLLIVSIEGEENAEFYDRVSFNV